MTANAGYLFYKKSYGVFTSVESRKIASGEKLTAGTSSERKEKVLTPIEIQCDFIENLKPAPYDIALGNSAIQLKTTNPGLLIGSGYNHETGVEHEFKIGFFFDYTTGLPVIPGSSVKGVLRSVFPKPYEPQEKQEQKQEYLRNILGNPDADIAGLEKVVFDGIDAEGKRLPLSKRDIFYDAFISGNMNSDKKIFGKDFITPHKHPLKNPIPLKFLKVLPGIVFKFQFDLKESGSVSIKDKKKLFQTILCDIGVGAKTNVGYGQLRAMGDAG